jgi:dynamin 1-like protein
VPIGDQPSDIEKQTRNLITEYIAKPNSVILAVSPANVDLVNSEALKLARHVDPMGKRTIGVLTKLDLMDHGTNAMDILSGRVYPLKLGFIGIVNRSQQDIQGNKSLSDALQAERDFFRHHPAYRNMANRCGTQLLAKSLNQTLMAHIRDRLPDIKARLNTLMGQTQQELASYGDVAFTGKEHRGSLILQLMTRFASSFISSIDGTSTEISTKELCGGARIYYIFNSVFGNSLEQVDPTQNLSVLDIRTAIRNSTGPRPSLFVPELAFDLLVKPQIKLLEIPSQRCVELVYEELIKICHTCGSTELTRYPRLQGKLIEVVSDLLREQLGPCSGYVASLIDIQRAYINTNHPNFLGAAAAMSSVINDKEQREKKIAMEAEKKRREQRRMKELQNGANGEEGEEGEGSEGATLKALPLRKHQSQTSRSMSPAVGRMMNGSQSTTAALNNRNRSPPGTARDSFLNYFFSKDSNNAYANPQQAAQAALDNRPGSRHVSQNSEPSFAQSIRRGDNKQPAHVLAMMPPDDDYDAPLSAAMSAPPRSPSMGGDNFEGGFVRFPNTCRSDCSLMSDSHQTLSKHLRLRNAKPLRPSSSAASSRRTSTLSGKQSLIKFPRPLCTFLSTTRRMWYKIGSSQRCTKRTCSRSSCTRTTQSRPSARSARSCSRHTRKQPRLWARYCKR